MLLCCDSGGREELRQRNCAQTEGVHEARGRESEREISRKHLGVKGPLGLCWFLWMPCLSCYHICNKYEPFDLPMMQ